MLETKKIFTKTDYNACTVERKDGKRVCKLCHVHITEPRGLKLHRENKHRAEHNAYMKAKVETPR